MGGQLKITYYFIILVFFIMWEVVNLHMVLNLQLHTEVDPLQVDCGSVEGE